MPLPPLLHRLSSQPSLSSRSRSALVLVFALAAGCVLAVVPAAQAAVRPFLLAGGSATRAEKKDLNEMLDEYTIREHGSNWEGGGGIRFIPGLSRSELTGKGREGLAGESPIEIRLRFTLGSGGLPDVRFSGTRSSGYSYPPRRFLVSSRETFTYTSWSLGGFFSARVYDRLGFYLGPVLQTAKYKADRAWTGETNCQQCGPAKDKSTVRYGAFEAGAHYTLRPLPLRFEGFWVPGRFKLSTTHIVQSENYTANFSTLKGSLGARVSWEF
jgi:hypothetical protein